MVNGKKTATTTTASNTAESHQIESDQIESNRIEWFLFFSLSLFCAFRSVFHLIFFSATYACIWVGVFFFSRYTLSTINDLYVKQPNASIISIELIGWNENKRIMVCTVCMVWYGMHCARCNYIRMRRRTIPGTAKCISETNIVKCNG